MPRKDGELGRTRVGEEGERTWDFLRVYEVGDVAPAAMVSNDGRADTEGFVVEWPSMSCIS